MEKPRQISKSNAKHIKNLILEWEDLCDDDDSFEEKEEFNETENDHQSTIEERKIEEMTSIVSEVNENTANIKKQVFNNQPKEEMIFKINEYDKSKIIINLFNIDNKATAEDITNYYQNIHIIAIHSNPNKTGNYDVEFNSKEEVLKLIEKGTGKINKRPFFMRLSYKNEKQVISNIEPKKNNKNHSKSNQNFSKLHDYQQDYYSYNRYEEAEFDSNIDDFQRTTSTRVFESNHKPKYNSDRKSKTKLKKNLSGQRYHSKIEYIKKKDEETHIQDFAKVNLISQIDETLEDFHTPENKNLNVSYSEDDNFHSFQNSSFELEKEKSPKSPKSHFDNKNTKNCNKETNDINENKNENANIIEIEKETKLVLTSVVKTEENTSDINKKITSMSLKNEVVENGKTRKKKKKKNAEKKEILKPPQRISTNNIFDVFS